MLFFDSHRPKQDASKTEQKQWEAMRNRCQTQALVWLDWVWKTKGRADVEGAIGEIEEWRSMTMREDGDYGDCSYHAPEVRLVVDAGSAGGWLGAMAS